MKKLTTFLVLGIFLFSFVNAAQGLSPEEAVAAELTAAKVAKQGNYTSEESQQVQLEAGENNRMQIQSEGISADTSLKVEKEISNGQTKFEVKLSNGKNAEIKVMPDTASERALERLRLKVCVSENNCTIELKEVQNKEELRVAYEIKAEKQAKVFGLFQTKMQVQAIVDAETGEVIQTGKPWWSFLASESDETAE